MSKINAKYLVTFIFIFMFCLFFKPINAKAADNYVWVGDSRFVGMENAIKDSPTFIAKAGKGLNWAKSKDIENYVENGYSIIFGLGMNDLGNVDDYIKYYNDLQSKCGDTNKIYILAVNPVCESLAEQNGYSIKNEDIENFNKKIKEGCPDCIYIDTYSSLKVLEITSGEGTTDGVHYNDTTYSTIYEIVKFNLTGEEIKADITELSDKTEYITPDKKDLKSMFNTELTDINVNWINKRKSFVVVQKNKGDLYAWIGVPNLQKLVWEKLDSKLINNGYYSDAIDVSKEKHLYTVDPKGHTAMQRLGFHIPSPIYNGEYSIIAYNPDGVVPTGFWSAAWNGIKGVFGGSVTCVPDSDNFNSLQYIECNDYIDDYGIVNWIKNNWNSIDWSSYYGSTWDTGLLSEEFCGNTNSIYNGNVYCINTCIIEPGLEKIPNDMSAEDFNKKLYATWGPCYPEIMKSISTLKGISINNVPLRDMPYSLEGLRGSSDSLKVNLVSDPRTNMSNKMMDLHFNPIKVAYKKIPVTISGFLCELSYTLEKISDFDALEFVGIDLTYLYKTIAFRIACGIITIIYIIRVLLNLIKWLREQASFIEIMKSNILNILLCVILIAFSINPDSTVNLFKTIMNLDGVINASLVDNSDNYNTYYSSQANIEEKEGMIYWIPYFESWTFYNTNHPLTSSSVTIKDETRPEQEGMTRNTIDGEEIKSWSYLLARSFSTQDGLVNSRAYRAVDHFMAPRVHIKQEGEITYVSSNENGNYNGEIQSSFGYNWIICISLLITQLIKTVWFFAITFEFMILFISLMGSSTEEGKVKKDLLGLLMGIAEYFLISVFIPLCSNLSLNCADKLMPCLLSAIIVIVLDIGFIKGCKSMPYGPKFLNKR